MSEKKQFISTKEKIVKEKPSYYAIIPANVRYDKRLNMGARMLYGEITCLCNASGECWASNQFFANLYDKSKDTVTRWIRQLAEYGYIHTTVIRDDETQQVIKRSISICGDYSQKCSEGKGKNAETPTRKNAGDNITSINNTRLIKDNVGKPDDNGSKKPSSNENESMKEKNESDSVDYKPKKGEPTKEEVEQIVRYFNKACNCNFRLDPPSHNMLKYIKKQWKRKYRFADFKKVIDVKAEQWKSDDKMCRYLRPETLFNDDHFESYLDEWGIENTDPLYCEDDEFSYSETARFYEQEGRA